MPWAKILLRHIAQDRHAPPRVGQIKLPKWANCSCQTQGGGRINKSATSRSCDLRSGICGRADSVRLILRASTEPALRQRPFRTVLSQDPAEWSKPAYPRT